MRTPSSDSHSGAPESQLHLTLSFRHSERKPSFLPKKSHAKYSKFVTHCFTPFSSNQVRDLMHRSLTSTQCTYYHCKVNKSNHTIEGWVHTRLTYIPVPCFTQNIVAITSFIPKDSKLSYWNKWRVLSLRKVNTLLAKGQVSLI